MTNVPGELVRFTFCSHGGYFPPDAVKPAQYFRRANNVEVQVDGTDKWVLCPYSSATEYQMTCSDCSPQAQQNGGRNGWIEERRYPLTPDPTPQLLY
ncbi:hypothetical protein PGT21_022385 [Puccinia graminis f. sp. tritici]|uniref:Uncharacterized protein n=1 Tax=Puccinia graminis f. sp. tritici TaxID=56615 RepID=A0A5B0LU31_PUCGR|nr:hypothetical protein PGT21_022385 [Puccinia graminis f. sp. tritici]KAA1137309.1 hypothetical protein PGTUg99_002470 [Puccinia graminis f. sp. tritici]